MNARMDADKRLLLCIYNTYNIFSLFTYPSIHEYKIHLAKGKYHLQNRVNASEHLIAWRVPRNLEKRSKLQPIVDHCAQSECCKNEFHIWINWNILLNSVIIIVATVPFYHISNYIFNLLIPPMRRKKLPWLKSFSDVLNFLGLLNVANFSLIGLPSGRASRGRFWESRKEK